MRRIIMRRIIVSAALACALTAAAFSQSDGRSVEELRRDTVRYGTDTEILDLIQKLASEKAAYLDSELKAVAEKTTNGRILSGIFGFFSDRDVPGLEDRAIGLIVSRDGISGEALTAAINYVGARKALAASDALKDILEAEEKAFSGPAVRSLGRIGSALDGGGAANMAEYLMDYYTDREPTDEVKREIIVALGELRVMEGVEFLADLAAKAEERPFRRITALEALKKIGHEGGFNAVLAALGAQDANVRAAAVAALGPFKDKKADAAILEAFRDSFYKARMAAASAAGERALAEAVPYLRYRAERDEVAAVKDEAIRALGAVADRPAAEALSALFLERRNSDRVRSLAAEQLLALDAPSYVERIIGELDEAKARKQNALYGALSKVLSTAETWKLKDLAARFISSGDVVEKAYGMEMAGRNGFRDLGDLIRPLAGDKNPTIARRAKEALEKLDLE